MGRRATTTLSGSIMAIISSTIITLLIALMSSGPARMSASASAVDVVVSNCSGTVPEGDLMADITVILLETDEFICDSLVTITANGPRKLEIVSTSMNVRVENVRFVITGGAQFSLSLGGEDQDGEAIFVGTTELSDDGGMFYVGSNSSATFLSPVHFKNNSVSPGYSGGAIYTDGEVVFEREVNFTGNAAGSGAAIAVGAEGSVTVDDFSLYTSNTAYSGQGGAILNLGNMTFGRASYFRFNEATEDDNGEGGEGGALYTGVDATTLFQRRTIMQYNEARSGGAIYNLGYTEIESRGFMRANQALGTAADGGHVYNLGSLSIGRNVNFRDGLAERDGGAIFVGSDATTTAGGTVFERNSVDGDCDDVYLQTPDGFVCDSELPE